MTNKLGLNLVLLLALIMAEPARAEQPVWLAAERAQANQLYQHGKVRAAARMLLTLAVKASAPADKVALENDAMEMCATAGAWDCVDGLVRDSLALLQSDPSLEAYRAHIAATWAKLMVWRASDGELERLVRGAGPFAPADPLTNPVDVASLNITLHDWFARKNDLKAAEQSLSAAKLAFLLVDQNCSNERIAELLVDLIQSLRYAQDIAGAFALATRTEPFIVKFAPRDGPTYARYLFEIGHLASYAEDQAKTAQAFGEAFQLIQQLDIADELKVQNLAIANGMASVALAVIGKFDEAKAMHARHPVQARKESILQRRSFRNAAEFYFAVSDVYLSNASGTPPDPRWEPAFDDDHVWASGDMDRREFEAFRNFARGTLAMWRKDFDSGEKFLMLAARQRIDNFDAALRANFEGFPLPGLLDKIIVSAGLFAATRSRDRDALDLMLRASELENRSLRHTLVDVAVVLDSQRDDEARRNAHSYIHLARQKQAWELDRISELLRARSQSGKQEGMPRIDILRQYTDAVTTLAGLKERLQRSTGFLPAKGLPSLDDLQQQLEPGSAYVAYFRSITGVGKLCVTHDRVVQAVVPLTAEVFSDAKLLEFATTATYPPDAELDAQFPVTAAIHMREFLFGGLESCLRPGIQVTVALPDELAGVPLGALLDAAPPRAGDGYDLAKAHWLIRDLGFSRVLSARQYLATMPYLRRAPAPRPYLGVGDPRLDATHVAQLASTAVVRGGLRPPNGLADLKELPETADELNAVAHLLGVSSGDILTRDAASEESFRAKLLGDYDVLHVASHGLLANEMPGLAESALVLTPVDGAEPFNDGVLTASEISRLSLNARLVVLSACNTAKFAASTAAAGVQDLQTAFTIAGTPTLLAALWPVDSPTARDIVVGFFKEWRSAETAGAADALARATRSFLASADAPHRHPRFWAPFVVAGNGGMRGMFDQSGAPALADFHFVPGFQNGGEVMHAANLGADVVLSMFSDWDGRRMNGMISRRAPDGAEKWRASTREIGVGRIATSGEATYALGYTTDQPFVPSLRAFDRSGGPTWTATFPELQGYVFEDVVVAGDGMLVVAVPRFLPASAAAAAFVMRFDHDGNLRKKVSLAVDMSKVTLGLDAYIGLWRDRAVVVINSRFGRTINPTKSIVGTQVACYPHTPAMLYEMDPHELTVLASRSLPDFGLSSMAISGEDLFLGGEAFGDCAMKGVAALMRMSVSGEAARIWKDGGLFPGSVRGLVARGRDIIAVISSERTLGFEPVVHPDPLSRDGRQRSDDVETTREGSLIEFSADTGAVVATRRVDAGLDVYLQGIEMVGERAFIYGSLGGVPAMGKY
ncbi:MAG TPA: CHAT domain-containing protein [Xanthobacteraceae bacterium]